MKNRIGIVTLVSVVVIAGIIAVVNNSTRSSEESVSGEQRTEAVPVAYQSATAGDDAEAAYTEMKERLEQLENNARYEKSPQNRRDIVRQMELLLSEFIDQYEGSPQAADASFDAGIVSLSLEKTKKAVQYLEGFLQDAVEPDRAKQAYAHYYLAQAYMKIGQYDDAEAEYQLVIRNFGDVDRRLSDMAAQSMSMLESERKLRVGAPPIGFEVTSTAGKKLSLDQYKGKVVLLDFWATWCGPCRQEMPNVIKVYDKYRKKGFEIVGVSLDRSRSDFDRYISQYNMTWPQYYDGKYWQNDIATLYGIKSIPATFLIDKKGMIRYKSVRGRQLEVAVEELLAE